MIRNTICHEFVLVSCISSNAILKKNNYIWLYIYTSDEASCNLSFGMNLSKFPWIILNSTLLFHLNINETSRISPLTLGKNSTPCREMIVSHSQAHVYLLCTENSLGIHSS